MNIMLRYISRVTNLFYFNHQNVAVGTIYFSSYIYISAK